MREGPPWLCISSSAGRRKRRKTNWTQSEVRSRSSNRGFGWKFRFLSSPLRHPQIIISTFFFPFSSSEYSTLLRSHPLPPLVGSPVNLSLGLSALFSTCPYGAKSPSATLLQHFLFSKQGRTHQQRER
ncbi:hypothetical protein LX32DRAFT_265021 [Colletotrichum zoysiae]|uniref:Uncharacterized protein n=1 Tax=Colletotrichum zoysiae TaxID=1216348 RepID=A0AAD9LWW5_9PEZI|nr:hypothetical protein LX32DRAFT_265021 [Colletotrichum zoysiae]